MGVSFHACVTVPEHVLLRELGEEAVVLDLDSEEYFGLDDVGLAMWRALTTAPSIDDGYQALLAEFDVDEETLRHDLAGFVDRLVGAGLLQVEERA